MASTPRKLVRKIQDAQKRIQRAEGKKVLIKKADAKPVAQSAASKSAQKRQRQDRLSLKDVMRETTPRTRQLMREGDVEVQSIRKLKSGRVIFCETITHKARGEVTKYKQVIRNEDPYDMKFIDSKAISVQCTCLTGDTKVLTNKGWKTMFELASPYTGELTTNYIVNGKVREGTNAFYTGKKKVWSLVLSNGTTVNATKDHKFLKYMSTCKTITTVKDESTGKRKGVYERKETKKWAKLENLRVGDKLILSNDKNTPLAEHNTDFYEAYFIGVMMGDGTLFADGRPDLRIFNKHKYEIIDILVKADCVDNVYEMKERAGLRVAFNHRGLELSSKYNYVNKMSINIENRDQLYGYLSGLVATDGCVGEKLEVYGGESYLKQLRDYLVEYGIPDVNCIVYRKKGISTNSIAIKYGMLTASKDMYRISININSMKRLNLVLPEDKQIKYDYLLDRHSDSGVHKTPHVKILDIKYNGTRWVYDITVPSVSKFVIQGGLIAHNCPRYKFAHDWALHQKQASDLNFSIDAPPDITNPERRLGCCKHLYRCLQVITQKGM